MDTVPWNVIKWAAGECDRQKTDPSGVYFMLNAWDWAVGTALLRRVPSALDLCKMAQLIEPVKNITTTSELYFPNFRRTPVSFANMSTAIKAELVADAVQRLIDQVDLNDALESERAEIIDEIVKALLDIHPWVDGNGRVMSIVHNWLSGTLLTPHELPYYYGTSSMTDEPNPHILEIGL